MLSLCPVAISGSAPETSSNAVLVMLVNPAPFMVLVSILKQTIIPTSVTVSSSFFSSGFFPKVAAITSHARSEKGCAEVNRALS
jgi:hypothetical protein